MTWKKRTTIIIASIIAGLYLVLIFILAALESGKGSINSLNDAFWYSIATLTTVGYGDLTPVTPAGRAIGVIFMILATTLLVALISSVVGFMTSQALPLWLLGRQCDKPWYYFADAGNASRILASQLKEEEPDSLIIFGISREQSEEAPDFPCLFLDVEPAVVLAKKKGHAPQTKMFFMREDDVFKNYRALHTASMPADVYARTRNGQDTLPGSIHFFHSYDCCARQYWRSHPLTLQETHIVLIGFGYYGQSLLERAILTNILSTDQKIVYHIFGDAAEFLQMHTELSRVFHLDEEGETGDALIFHRTSWKESPEILAQADRIILCEDDDRTVWENYWLLKRFYVVPGTIHIRSARAVTGMPCFGASEDIYTPGMVLRTTLNSAAIAMNDLYRRANPAGAMAWDDLDDLLRQSKIAAADHLLTKVRILLKKDNIYTLNQYYCLKAYERYQKLSRDQKYQHELRILEHMRWMRFYTYFNWKHGETVDPILHLHPNICDYADIPKDKHGSFDFAWELLGQIAPELSH